MRRALIPIGAAIALAFALGHLSAPESKTVGSPSPGGPAATLAHRYPQTRAGASLAAAAYQQSFAGVSILRPGVLRRRIEAVATPGYARAMLAANAPGTARLAAGGFGEGIRRGVESVYFAVPLGYRLLAYSPRRARVLTWGFTVLGNAAAIEPTAYFGTSRVELSWREGGWRISGIRSAFGPTPRLGTPRRGGEGFEVIGLTRELRPYGVAP